MEGNKKNINTNMQVAPFMRSIGSWARDNKSKADVFADYLADIFELNETELNIIIKNGSNKYEAEAL